VFVFVFVSIVIFEEILLQALSCSCV